MLRLSAVLLLALWTTPGETLTLQDSPAAIEGTWSARVYTSERAATDPERLQLQISLDDETSRGWNNWGQSIRRAEFTNLPTNLDARQDVTFELRREAGTIVFAGRFENGRGVGTLRFTPDAAFTRALEQQTNDTFSRRELFSYALLDVSQAFVREMQALGFASLTLADARKLRIHGVSADYVREIRAAGLGGSDLDDVLQLRIHGVTAEFAREMRALAGDEALDAGDIRQLRIHGVTPAYVREMRAAGLAMSIDDMRQARIHGVTPAFAREMAALGYGEASFDRLRQFRIHGVTPAYVRAMADLGYRNVDAGTLVQFRIHGVTPKFVTELREAGYTSLSEDDLVDWAIHGRRLLRHKRK